MTLQRVHRVTVENWRNWQDPFTLDDLGHGLVVLGGPNGVGKTGLWGAIVHGLLDRHWGIHTERLRPAGTKRVIPRVDIEFDAGGGRFRVEKHFSGSGGRDKATFFECVQGKWVVRDQGEEAFLLCRKAVLGTDSATQNRGGLDHALQDTLLQILLPSQGTLVEKAPSPQAISVAVTDRGAAAAATRLGKILALITAEADKLWAGQRGVLKKGTELGRDLEALEALEVEARELEQRVARIDELVARVNAATEELAGMGDAAHRLEEAKTLDQEARTHREKREAARKEFEFASQTAADREAARNARSKFIADITDREEALAKASREQSAKEETLHRAQRNLGDRGDLRDGILKDLDTLRAWTEFETRGARLKETQSALESVRARQSAVKECRGHIESLRREKAGLLLPQPCEWDEWDALEKARQEADGRLTAGAWTVEGSVPADLSITVDGRVLSSAGVSTQASRYVEVSSPGGETLRATAPPCDAAEGERCAKAVRAFLDRFGTADIRELRKRHTYVTGTIDPKIAAQEARLKQALDGQTPEDLLKDEGRLLHEVERKEALKAPDMARPEGDPDEWRIRIRVLDKEHGKSQKLVEEASAAAGTAASEEKSSRKAHSEAERLRDAARDAVAAHRAEHGPDDVVGSAADDARHARDEKEAAWKPLHEEKDIAEKAKETRAIGLRDNLEEILERRESIKKLEGELSTIRSDDPEGRLAVLLAQKAALIPRVRAERARANALLLLETTLKEERDRLTEAIGGPIRERLHPWVRYLLQDSSEVVVGEDGWPRVIKKPAGQEVPYEDESFGTREQIGVLYRLAVADLVTGKLNPGVCLMLDDPFGHSSRDRRRRMLEILQSEAERRSHQVLLFTCRPEDFEGIGHHVLVGG